MKQKAKTPEMLDCICGTTPQIMPAATGWNHYEKHYMVRCKECTRRWPRNASTIHRAVCRWNNHVLMENDKES
jgi:hypothetical protein